MYTDEDLLLRGNMNKISYVTLSEIFLETIELQRKFFIFIRHLSKKSTHASTNSLFKLNSTVEKILLIGMHLIAQNIRQEMYIYQ